MSWLIILFFINGQPTMVDGFPAKLVPTAVCTEQQQKIVGLIAEAFPNTTGVAFCIPDNNRSEAPNDGA